MSQQLNKTDYRILANGTYYKLQRRYKILWLFSLWITTDSSTLWTHHISAEERMQKLIKQENRKREFAREIKKERKKKRGPWIII